MHSSSAPCIEIDRMAPKEPTAHATVQWTIFVTASLPVRTQCLPSTGNLLYIWSVPKFGAAGCPWMIDGSN